MAGRNRRGHSNLLRLLRHPPCRRLAPVPRSGVGLRLDFPEAVPPLLQQHGGWADRQVPDQIYRNNERERARDEARHVRSRVRGEAEWVPGRTCLLTRHA
jgi:hypothetical protein